MADQTTDWRINFDDDGMLEAMKALSAQGERMAKSLQDVEKAGEVAFDPSGVNDYEASMEKLDKTMQSSAKAARKESEALAGVGREATEAARGISIFGVNLGETADQLKGVAAAMRASIAGTTGMSKALKVLKVALISTGIGAIVVALGSLVAFLTQTQKGMDAVSKVTTIAGEIFQRAILSVASFGEALIKVVQLDFKGAMDSARTGVDGLKTAFQEGYEAGNRLYRLMIDIREQTQTTNQVIAATNREIATQQRLAEDTSQSLADRLKSYDRILELLDAQTAERERLAALEEEDAREKLARDRENEEAQDRFFEAQRNMIQVQTEAEDRRREFINGRNAAQDEYIRGLREEQQIMADTFRDIQRYVADREGTSIFLDLDEEIGRIEDFITFLQQQGNPAFDGLIDKLSEFRNALETELLERAGRAGDDNLLLDPLLPNDAQVAQAGDALGDDVDEMFERAAARANSGPGKRSFQDIASDLQESLEAVMPDIQSTIGSIGDILASITEPQLEAQERYVDALRSSTETLERELESQYRLREQGYANDVSALEKRLQQENAALARAERRKLEIQRKAAREQLVIDSLQQASQLALAVATLTAEGAKLGPFGFIAAITAGVATIFSVFARAKALASEQTAIPQFREGGPVDGPSHERGGVLAELEGGEYVMSRSAVNAHGDLIEAINEGSVYDYLPSLVESGEKHQATLARTSAVRIEEAAAMRAAEMMIDYWKTRPIDTPLNQSILREYQVGNTRIRKKIKQR